MRQTVISFLAAAVLVWSGLTLKPVWAGELYFIDVHSQVEENFPDLGLITKRMDEAGVRQTILSARTHKTPSRIILDLAGKYPDRIIPAVRTKGRPYVKDSGLYYKQLAEQVKSGRYRAMAEVLIHHAQKGKMAREIRAGLSEKKVVTALNYALANNWPFIIHIEFGSLSDNGKKRNLADLDKLLAQHPKHHFGLSHMGQLTTKEAENLIKRHPNVFFQTSHANPVSTSNSNQPWTDMFEGYAFSPEWKKLMVEHPDRFVFTLDNVWAFQWKRDYLPTMEYWKKALAELPPEAAAQIAHGNAERIWGLK